MNETIFFLCFISLNIYLLYAQSWAITKDKGRISPANFLSPIDNKVSVFTTNTVSNDFVLLNIEKALKNLNYDFRGMDVSKHGKDLSGWRYLEFAPPLIRAMRESSSHQVLNQNEDLKRKMAKYDRTMMDHYQ